MIGKVIGAALGAEASKFTTSMGGPTGAVLGVLATPLVRRLSIPGMVALGVVGYFAKKYFDRRNAQKQDTVAMSRKVATENAAQARKAARGNAGTAAAAA